MLYYVYALFSHFRIMAYMNTSIAFAKPNTYTLLQRDVPKVEMHCHSTRSDGRNTPLEVVWKAKERGLDFITLTDHDTISPKDFQMNCKAAWIGTCDSVEVSARNYEHEKSLHLVSYANIFSESLRDVLDQSLDGKKDMKIGQFQKILDMWYEGTQEDFDTFMENKLKRAPMTSNKYDMARYLLSIPANKQRAIEVLWDLCTSEDVVLHFYIECLKRWWELYEMFWYEVDDYEPSVEQTVREVSKKSWGLVSLAHPNFTFEKWGTEEFKRVLPDYVKKWVWAVEINARATPEWIHAILEARRKYDLILTFGTDCHEIWTTDRKHWDLWQLNSHLPGELIEQNFERFKKKTWLWDE